MRIVRNFRDVQLAFNELFEFKDKTANKAPDMAGRQIKNGAPSSSPTDFVIQSELTQVRNEPTDFKYEFAAIFSKEDPSDDDFSPPYFVGRDRDGELSEVWLSAVNGPSGGDLSIQVYLDYEDGITDPFVILDEPLIIADGDTVSVWTSKFIDTYPKAPIRSKLYVHVITSGGASLISVGVIIKRRKTQDARSGRN